MAGNEGYLLDNQQVEAGQRFAALSELFDPVTFRHLTAVGVAEGWVSWEVGAGGTALPSRLAARVGPSGRVLASAIDTSWMRAAGAGFQVRRHDIGVDGSREGPSTWFTPGCC